MSRILHWTERFWPVIGGIETLVWRLADYQRAHGHEIAIATNQLASPMPEVDMFGGIAVHRHAFTDAMLSADMRLIREATEWLARLKAEFRPDVIHLHTITAGLWVHHLAQGTRRTPTVVTLHAPPDHIPLPLIRRTLEETSAVAMVSAALGEEYRSVSYPLPRSTVIWNGLPASTAAPAPLPCDPPHLLCIGRLEREKGFDLALRAFAATADEFTGARLAIAGSGSQDDALRELARVLGIDRSVDFLGPVLPNDVHEVINQSCLVIMPSRWREPFGLVALEAAQMARPLLGTRTGGLPEIVIEGETGILVPPDQLDPLAEALAGLMAKPDDMVRMGAAGRVRVASEFTMERCAESYEELYRKAIGAKGAPA